MPRAKSVRFFVAVAAVALLRAAPALATPCASPSDCPTGFCDPTRHVCVGCLSNADCRGPAPVCDHAAGFCGACTADHGASSGLACSAAHPVCVTAGPHNGECTECSAGNASACTTASRPACTVSLGLCGCGTDTDCAAGLYCDHDVAAEGWCVYGCHVVGGVDRCAPGSHCDARDGSIGNCKPGECTVDADCGAAASGRICNATACVDGCRGAGGNGCPSSLVCSSPDNLPGKCAPPTPPVDAGVDASTPEDASADADVAKPVVASRLGGCALAPPESASGAGAGLVALAALVVARARRRG